MSKPNQNPKKGFTLLELMIVIVILGILATIVMPRIMGRPEQARRTKAVAEISQIEGALHMFKLDTGRFPSTAEGLDALVNDPGVENYKPDGYLNKIPLDPWGNNYVYIYPSVHGNKDYDLLSYGPDGENGGNGINADIVSWNLDQVR